MSEKEFLDLLRYYFRNVKTEDVEEILNDYRSHFADAKERGMTEEEITKELGRPEDIYLSYRTEGVVNEKGHMERLSDRAEILANKTQKKATEAWNEISPRLPEAAGATASVLVKTFYWACSLISVVIFGLTALIVYLLSIHFTPIPGTTPLPGLHIVTLCGLAGTGIFAALSIYFTGLLGRNAYKNKAGFFAARKGGESL